MLVVIIIIVVFWMLTNVEEFFVIEQMNRAGFSMSKKPMEADWSSLNNGPFDDIDYITPQFITA